MKLATWQPKAAAKITQEGFERVLAEYLGFAPAWCFSAEDLDTLYTQSLLFDAEQPEKLILFETENVTVVNRTEYMKAAADNTQTVSDNMFWSDEKHALYAVRDIPEDAFSLDVSPEETRNIFKKFNAETAKTPLELFIRQMADVYLKYASQEIICPDTSGCDLSAPAGSNGPAATLFRNKSVFELTLLPVCYIIFNLDSLREFDQKFLIMEMCRRFYGTSVEDVQAFQTEYEKWMQEDSATYLKSDAFNALYDKVFYRTLSLSEVNRKLYGKKIYPNDHCPCGSGKKFKKCHSGIRL